MLLHHKCELALVDWILAHRGELLAGVNICAAHINAEVPVPILVVTCMRARPHPDFEGCGRQFPQSIPTLLRLTTNAHDATHETSIGRWVGELDGLLAGDNYAAVIAALNPPASGSDTRARRELYVYAIHPGDDGGDFDGENFDECLALEIVAQNGDPA